MKKVGILTFQNSNNHGALLQAYATQQTLKKLGCKPQIVNYVSSTMESGQQLLPEFEEFRDNYLDVSQKIEKEKLSTCDYDAWIIGSDQVWNINITGFDDAYFMPTKDAKKLIPYAASFGMQNEDIIKKGNFLAENLKHFEQISIREESNIDAVQKLIGKKPEVLCHIDPTLLLDAYEYEYIIQEEKDYIPQGDYILFFSYNSDPRFIDWVNILSYYLGMPIIAVTSLPYNKFIKGTRVLSNVSTSQWLSLIKNAKIVSTDSYHGLMFSMIFRKNFYIYTSNCPGVTRLMHVLNKYGFLGQRICENDNPSRISFEVDYTHFEKVIEEERLQASAYLKTSIERIG